VIGMADEGFGRNESARPVSTPLHRAAGRLQAMLPPGWRVDVVETPSEPGQIAEPSLRIVMLRS
jgi:hypothetical protein